MLVPFLYNAPVSFYAALIQSGESITVEQYDNYTKQTYRNRCRILGANGPIDLVIPVVKEHGKKIKMKDVRIDYATNWNKIHWRSIYSAYASAPFFEFYEPDLRPLYKRKITFLSDLNLKLMELTLAWLQWQGKITLSTSFSYPDPSSDLRDSIHPKKPFTHENLRFHPAPYHQVFAEKHGFVPNLSILDLFCNEGANSRVILQQSCTGKAK